MRFAEVNVHQLSTEADETKPAEKERLMFHELTQSLFLNLVVRIPLIDLLYQSVSGVTLPTSRCSLT